MSVNNRQVKGGEEGCQVTKHIFTIILAADGRVPVPVLSKNVCVCVSYQMENQEVGVCTEVECVYFKTLIE